MLWHIPRGPARVPQSRLLSGMEHEFSNGTTLNIWRLGRKCRTSVQTTEPRVNVFSFATAMIPYNKSKNWFFIALPQWKAGGCDTPATCRRPLAPFLRSGLSVSWTCQRQPSARRLLVLKRRTSRRSLTKRWHPTPFYMSVPLLQWFLGTNLSQDLIPDKSGTKIIMAQVPCVLCHCSQ